MHLSIHSKPPGFKVKILKLPSSEENGSNFVSRLFFGKTNTITEIPITNYKVEK